MSAVVILRATGPGVAVLSGDLVMPLRGNWFAHLVTGAGAGAPVEGERVTIFVAANPARRIPEARFVGTVRRAGKWGGQHEIVIVGGAGGLTTELAGDDLVGHAKAVPLEVVADRIASTAGEVLDDTVLDNLKNYAVPRWTRARGPAGSALSVMVDEFGLSWRVLDTGAVWLGLETWPELKPAALGYELEEQPDDGTIRAASGGATLRPGIVVLGRRVTRVRYDFGGEVVAELLTAVSGERAFIDRPLVYREQHAATVVDVHDDDSVDLTLDTDILPGLQNVRLRAGMPGARLVSAVGDRVRVRFDGASPQEPCAAAFDQDSTATKGVARVGDLINVGTLSVAMAGPDPVFTYTPPGLPPEAPSSTITLFGFVTSGSDEVFLR